MTEAEREKTWLESLNGQHPFIRRADRLAFPKGPASIERLKTSNVPYHSFIGGSIDLSILSGHKLVFFREQIALPSLAITSHFLLM